MTSRIQTYNRKQLINGNPHDIFSFMDDLAKTGMHMTKRSVMMMGSKLTLQELSGKRKGVGATFRWFGKMMGMKIDFTETVTEWNEDVSKKWETIGDAKIILFSWYEMGFEIERAPNGYRSNVNLWISYKQPHGWFNKILCFLFARMYCQWCLGNMLNDTKTHVESLKYSPHAIHTAHIPGAW